MPELLQSHANVCGFFTVYAAFYDWKFRQEEKLKFTMLLYSHMEVTIGNEEFQSSQCKRAGYITFFYMSVLFNSNKIL